MSDQNQSTIGGGFWGLLTIAFVVLKLTGVIGWPWVWVLAPVWAPIAAFILVVIILAALQ